MAADLGPDGLDPRPVLPLRCVEGPDHRVLAQVQVVLVALVPPLRPGRLCGSHNAADLAVEQIVCPLALDALQGRRVDTGTARHLLDAHRRLLAQRLQVLPRVPELVLAHGSVTEREIEELAVRQHPVTAAISDSTPSPMISTSEPTSKPPRL